jgi:hypothetical protein
LAGLIPRLIGFFNTRMSSNGDATPLYREKESEDALQCVAVTLFA